MGVIVGARSSAVSVGGFLGQFSLMKVGLKCL